MVCCGNGNGKLSLTVIMVSIVLLNVNHSFFL